MSNKTCLGFIPVAKNYDNIELGAFDFEGFDFERNRKISLFLKKILLNKFQNKQEIVNFLNPSIKNLQDPIILKDLNEGMGLLKESLIKNERILIFGDYDVDGSTSAALLINFLKDISFDNFDFFIPDRIEDGYGLNKKSLQKILEKNFDLLITLDCGTSSVEEIDILNGLNKKCLIIDHHKSSSILPKCLIINPNRGDFLCEEFKDLCACGVLFLFLCKFFTFIKDDIQLDKFKNIQFKNIQIENKKSFMSKYLDLVGLATVCDVMPLVKQNRIFVVNALKNINQKKCNIGISRLIEISGLSKDDIINSYHFGFIIGPKINAGGRIGKSDLGTKMLSNLANEEEIIEIAHSLKSLNEIRMSLEKQALEFIDTNDKKIKEQIAEFGFIFQFHEDWHEGIIGILSSRIKDKYQRPTFVGNININEDKIKASARSIGNIDIGDLILKANENNLLITGGGHKMAGGLSIYKAKLLDFMKFSQSLIQKKSDEYFNNREIIFDFAVSLSALNIALAEEMNMLQPFGNGNLKPIFKISDAEVRSFEVLKDKHLKVLLTNQSYSCFAICFGAIDNEAGKSIMLKKKLDFFVNIDINHFNDRRYLSINIIDVIEKYRETHSTNQHHD